MAPKLALAAFALCAMALAGCTSGSDDGNGDGMSTSETGTGGVGGCVSGPGGGACANATASGSGSGSMTNTSTNGTAGALENADVLIQDSSFINDTVTIMVGGSVKWTHADGQTAHTATADGGSFDSNPSCTAPVTPLSDCMTQGDTYTATFATAGEFDYHCKVHSGMTGTVRVVEE